MTSPVVIIGTGLAGYNLAREFRKLDGETPLLLITADDGRSYSKPMLSTGFAKLKDADGLCMAEPGAMAEQLKAEIRTHTRISGIDPGHKRLWIGEEAVAYRDLVLAWGPRPCRCRSRAMLAGRFSRSMTWRITHAFAPPLPANSACWCWGPG